jgi:hypothetical protein
LKQLFDELGKSIARWTELCAFHPTAVSGLSLFLLENLTELIINVYEPGIWGVVQGAKRMIPDHETNLKKTLSVFNCRKNFLQRNIPNSFFFVSCC